MPTKTSLPKIFSVWSWINFPQSKEQKICGKKTINICHLPKKDSRQVLPFQKMSVFETEYDFFQSKEGNECERSVWISIFVTF